MTKEEKSNYDKAWAIKNKEYLKNYRKKYYIKHKEKQKLSVKKWKEKNKEQVKEYNKNKWLNKRYGISLDAYNNLFLIQNGKCAICNTPVEKYKRSLHVDHDHITGKIRGLLCVKCNYGLGYFQDNITLLDQAKTYLENSISQKH